ncbi:MAG: DNA polymerase I [Tissierellia bacterium]|nr:DNA polymerase I [Tissierellia bacterium]
MQKKILLIDGSSLLFRAFYAIQDLKTTDGIMTNGVYGFLTMYFNAMKEHEPDYVLVAFDRKTKTFRHKEFKEYKGTRDKIPDEINHQFGILKDILDSLRIKYMDLDGFEADDIVGTYAKIAKDEKIETVIITGDRDYLQLVDDNTTVFYTLRGVTNTKKYDIEAIRKEYGIEPEQLIDVKGLMGDKSDNIPGIDGIGEKTALKYIKKYSSLENLFNNIDDIKGKKTKERLIEGETIAYMSKKIGTIVRNCPVELEIEQLKVKEPDYESLIQKFNRYNFNSFLKKLPDQKLDNHEEKTFDYEITNNIDIIKGFKNQNLIFFKLLYNGENYIHSKAEYLALKAVGEKSFLIKIDDIEIDVLKSIFEDDGIKKVSFDIKEDMFLFDKKGVNLSQNYEDVMLMQYLLDPSRTTYDLKTSSQNYLTYSAKSKEEVLGKGRKLKKYDQLTEDEIGGFSAQILNVIEDLFDILTDKLKDIKMHSLYKDVELKLVKVLSDMEISGFKADKQILNDLKKDLEIKIEKIENEIYELAGSKFNINSPKQLAVVLFEDLKLPVIKKTKTGYSTNQKVLDKLRDRHPIISKIENYRELSKLMSTYIDGLIKSIDNDGRIRSTFRQNVTATGRISSTEPNLQNLPIRTEEGRKIRKAFVANDHNILVDADYSQIELRVLSHLTGDKKMQEAFKNGEDIHQKTASEVFHVSLDEVTKTQRSRAKAVNFGIVYGISDYGLSQNLNIPRKEAKKYIENYKNSYPEVKKYMNEIVKKAKEDGYTQTIFNRRRYIPEINSKNFNVRSFGERIALNTPIQGSAADIIKIAMIRVYEKLKKEKVDAKIILQIHDEIILESSKEDKDKAMSILKDTMQECIKLDVPLDVDIDTGLSLYESK